MIAPGQAWERYAEKARPRRRVNAAGASSWLNWTQYPDHGPNESILGSLPGQRVLELGSGAGANLAHLATLGARCIGVDVAPTRIHVARQNWAGLPNLEFVTGDATDYLTTTTDVFAVVYSIFGAVWFTDPALLLPLVHRRLTSGGILAFSHLPPTERQRRSSPRSVTTWDYPPGRWVRMLTATGFDSVTAEVIPAPTTGTGTLLVRALAP